MRYHHLSLEERSCIGPMRAVGFSLQQIAVKLGRHTSTISRELRRNTDETGGYAGYWAEGDARRRRRQAPRPRRLNNLALATYVQMRLQARWSPQQIAHRVRRDFPAMPRMRVSHQTLYTWIARDKAAGGSYHLCLRQGHRTRRKRYGSGARPPRIKDRVDITQRPVRVAQRDRVGDWEGDTLVGKGHRVGVTTHVERKSRFLVATKTPRHTAQAVTDATCRALQPIPPGLRKTLTVDNGSEWVAFRELQQVLGLRVYFATPYAAWERGTNENTNGLLRDYFPKSTDFSQVTPQQLASVVRALNNRPRKCLNYRTPAEVFSAATRVALRL